MSASFAGTGQNAAIAADVLAWKRLLMIAILASALNQRCEDLEAELRLRLLHKIAGSPRQIVGDMMVEGLRFWYQSRGYLQPGKNFLDHNVICFLIFTPCTFSRSIVLLNT